MKQVFVVLILLISSHAYANAIFCQAQKSLMKFNPDTQKVETRRAVTSEFSVTLAEYEDPKTFEFFDEDGKSWGSVQVSTGSHDALSGNWFYASATVAKPDGSIAAFLNLKSPYTSLKAEASTLVFGEEVPPNLSVSCRAAI